MAAKAKTITVYATTTLAENGTIHPPGDKIQTTEERAAALGDLVTSKAPE